MTPATRARLHGLVEEWRAMMLSARASGPIPHDEIGHVSRWTAVEMCADQLAACLAAEGPALQGAWPTNDLRRAFVDGAKWWEWESRQATMWPNDRNVAEAEAERRYGLAVEGDEEPPMLADAAEMLWVVLANVSGGNWKEQSPEWQEEAARWRDNYFAAVKAAGVPIVASQASPEGEP